MINFIDVEQEMKKAFTELAQEQHEAGTPFASHMGGSFEQWICSVRTILASILKTHGDHLHGKFLLTLINEEEEFEFEAPNSRVPQ